MARPTTKIDLLKAANTQFDTLWEVINSLGEDPQSIMFNFGENFHKKEAHWMRDKNLRDILIHLYAWHQLLLNWVSANQKSDAKPFLPAPYNWKNYGQMNMEIWQKHQSIPYEDAKKMLFDSHQTMLQVIDTFSDDALFKKQYFAWTGSTSLGAYCVSATSSHYDWAIKKLKTYIKAPDKK